MKTVKILTIQNNDRVQLREYAVFAIFLIMWRALVSIVCIHAYIVIICIIGGQIQLAAKTCSATDEAAPWKTGGYSHTF